MTKRTIKGLSEIYHKYDVFLIDLWGVIHNGKQLYSGAIEVLENLNRLNKRFVLFAIEDQKIHHFGWFFVII